MNNKTFAIVLFALFLLTLQVHLALEHLSDPPSWPANPRRIVSLAPSITETLYELDLGPRVAGVTLFCVYPAEVKSKPKVAGFSDINYEALMRTRPDLVLLPRDKAANRRSLERLGLPVLSLNTRTIGGLLDSINLLGQITGQKEAAAKILGKIRKSLAAAHARAQNRPRPTVLFSVMRSYQGLGYIKEVAAVGQDGFYSEMIREAGGRNAYQGKLAFPRLSREALIFLNPEVIIDVLPVYGDQDKPSESFLTSARQDWLSLTSVKAVQNGRIYIFADSGDTVPGPRFYLTLNKLSRIFHPDQERGLTGDFPGGFTPRPPPGAPPLDPAGGNDFPQTPSTYLFSCCYFD